MRPPLQKCRTHRDKGCGSFARLLDLPDHLQQRSSNSHQDVKYHYYDAVAAFGASTDVAVVHNKRFDESDPILCRPEQAIDCFCGLNVGIRAMGRLVGGTGQMIPLHFWFIVGAGWATVANAS